VNNPSNLLQLLLRARKISFKVKIIWFGAQVSRRSHRTHHRIARPLHNVGSRKQEWVWVFNIVGFGEHFFGDVVLHSVEELVIREEKGRLLH